MHVPHGHDELREPAEHPLLAEGLSGPLDVLEEASAVGVLHDHVEHALLHERAVVPHDGRVRERRQNADLIARLGHVGLAVVVHEDALDDEPRVVRPPPHQDHAALRAAAKARELLEVLHGASAQRNAQGERKVGAPGAAAQPAQGQRVLLLSHATPQGPPQQRCTPSGRARTRVAWVPLERTAQAGAGGRAPGRAQATPKQTGKTARGLDGARPLCPPPRSRRLGWPPRRGAPRVARGRAVEGLPASSGAAPAGRRAQRGECPVEVFS